MEPRTLLVDTVKRGQLVPQVRGLGTLVPEATGAIEFDANDRLAKLKLVSALVRRQSERCVLGRRGPSGRL